MSDETTAPPPPIPLSDEAAFEHLQAGRQRVTTELAKVIVGQDDVIEQLLVTLLAGGHGLLTGAPGLAKTLLVKSVASAFQLQFQRIQFTPDLMPADITGTEILTETPEGRRLSFVRGPVFTNLLLADEINRTPPKTQAALLTPGHGRGHSPHSQRTVFCSRNAEPGGNGRHLPPARSPARPLSF